MKYTNSILKHFIFILFSCISSILSADTWVDENGIQWVYSVSYDGATIGVDHTNGYSAISSSTQGEVTVPSKIGKSQSTVTAIGDYAFYKCEGLTHITIPDSVTSIGDASVFEGCTSLKSVTLPNRITSLPHSLFYGCTALTSITIPNSVTSIPYDAFYGCTSLTSVTIPDSVTSIQSGAFASCTALTSVTIPASVTSLSPSAFSASDKLNLIIAEGNRHYASKDGVLYNRKMSTLIGLLRKPETYKIPEGITTIGTSAFSGYISLSSVTIPNSVTTIENSAFYGCTNLTEIHLPDGVTTIGASTFQNCTSLTSITIPDSVTSIGDSAFYGCTNLTEIHLPDGVTTIGASAFQNCTSLTAITIPDSVTTIEDSAFYGCTNLTEISLPDSLINIGDDAFYNCNSLTEINLPNNVTNIGYNAFDGCSSLTSITLTASWIHTNLDKSLITKVVVPKGTTHIRESAFNGCSNLIEITLPDSITSIGNLAFYECSKLTSILIPDGVTTIGYSAFYDCRSLTEIVLPKGVTKIGIWTFGKCANLKHIQLPDALTSIQQSAFSGCSSLTSISIPDSVTFIGNQVFSGCGFQVAEDGAIYENVDQKVLISAPKNVAEFTIPKSVKWIYDSAFSGYSSLASVTIPDSVIGIGSSAFSGCSSLTSVTIPDSVTFIGIHAFVRCGFPVAEDGATYESTDKKLLISAPKNVAEFTIQESVKWLHSSAFDDSALTSITIPDGVTCIGEYTFDNCASLTSVKIPTSVAFIGYSAFYGCTSLVTVEIPNDAALTSIENETFSNCNKLTAITIPNGVTSIGYAAFKGCSSLQSITFPNGITSIGNIAFRECSRLQSITIPTSAPLSSIGYEAFYKCSSLTEIILPDELTSIGMDAFYNCSGLKEISLPKSVTSVGNYAFQGCTGLTEITLPDGVTFGSTPFKDCTSVTSVNASWVPSGLDKSLITKVVIPEGTTIIRKGTFSGCSNLTSITIPDGVTMIGNNAFQGCTKLTEITLPDSITTIGDSAFYNCYKLTGIPLPNGVTTIGESAFRGCSNLTEIILPSTVTSIGDLAFYDCYCITSTEASWLLPGLKARQITKVVIPEGTTTIRDGAFSGCTNLREITIPESVKVIGDEAFSDCTSLTSISIPNSVTSIGDSAFYGCNELTSISLPNGITAIEDYAFQGCTSLTEIHLPDSVTTIGEHAFHGCTDLTSIRIPDGVTTIGKFAFYGCEKIREITLPNSVSVKDIGDKAFFGCNRVNTLGASWIPADLDKSQLTHVVIPEGTQSIPEATFSGCSNLVSVTIPDSVTSIGESAFSGCSEIEEITLPDRVMFIGASAFSDCRYLTSITIPDGVTSIEDSTFAGCGDLTSITIPNSVTSIGNSAFSGCGYLTGVTFPKNLTLIGNKAFYSCSLLRYVAIPESVISIGESAFSGCFEVKEISIPNEKVFIGENVFSGCDTVTSILASSVPEGITRDRITKVVIPEKTTIIRKGAFSGCSKVSEITLPNGVTTIEDEAFYGCNKLTAITLPEGLTSIGERAFYECYSLMYVMIPDSVTTLGAESFDSSLYSSPETISIPYHLKDDTVVVALEASGCTIIVRGEDGIDSSTEEDGAVIVGIRDRDATEVTLPASIEGNPVTTIGAFAFENYTHLQRLDLPSTLTRIEEGAFTNCSSLEEIVIPMGVTSIGEGAFTGCSALKTISVPFELMEAMTDSRILLEGNNAVVVIRERVPYMVIDLSAGSTATSYPITFLEAIPEERWTDTYKTTKLVLRRIPAGSFMMGSSETETGRNDNEDLHHVTLTKDFWIGVFEVTQKQWELVMGTKPSSYCGDARPADSISYNMIRGHASTFQWPQSSEVAGYRYSFMGALRYKLPYLFDLPTEAQWEYACRAGTTSPFNNATESMANLGRYAGNTSDGKGGGYTQHTTVGSYTPNAWGLYDMHGNVWEWCVDRSPKDAEGSSLPLGADSVTDPVGYTYGDNRIERGGDWTATEPTWCRSAFRDSDDPSATDPNYGFRLACTVENTPPAVVLKPTLMGYTGNYDGREHTLDVILPPGMTAIYATTATGPYTTELPRFTACGDHTVWYRIEKDEKLIQEGSASVIIEPIVIDGLTLSGKSRYPWSGEVDLTFTVDAIEPVAVTLTAEDASSCTAVAMKTLTCNGEVFENGSALPPGTTHILWDMAADTEGTVATDNLVISALASNPNMHEESATMGPLRVYVSEETIVKDPWDSVDIHWSGLWAGDETATVVVQIGSARVVDGLSGEGSFVWDERIPGTYTFTHLTYLNNILKKRLVAKIEVPWKQFSSNEVQAQAYSGVYDGLAHTITVTAPEAATISYALSEEGPFTEAPPTFSTVGTYTVWYRVEKTGYTPLVTSATVTITPAQIPAEKINVETLDRVFDGSAASVVVSAPEGATITYALSKDGPYTAEIPTFTDVCSCTLWFKVELEHYAPYVGSVQVTIRPAEIDDLQVTAVARYPWNGFVDIDCTLDTPDPVQITLSAVTSDGTTVSIQTLSQKSAPFINGTSRLTSGTTRLVWNAATDLPTNFADEGLTLTLQAASANTLARTCIVTDVALDLTTSPRQTLDTIEPIRWSSLWAGDETSTVVLKVNDNVIVNHEMGEGIYAWEEKEPGIYTFTHLTYQDGEVIDQLVTTFEIPNKTFTEGEVMVQEYTGTYDSLSHTITVTAPEEATITYALNAEGPFNEAPPSFSDIGTYTVWYRVEKLGYQTLTGKGEVVITQGNGPTVRLSASTRYPWSGRIDLFCTVDFIASMILTIEAIDGKTGNSLPVSALTLNGTAFVNGVSTVQSGNYCLTWDAAQDLEAGFHTENLTLKLTVSNPNANDVSATTEGILLDLSNDGRVSNGVESLPYNARWGGGEDATVFITANGKSILSNATGSGSILWTTADDGDVCFTLTVRKGEILLCEETMTVKVTACSEEGVPFSWVKEQGFVYGDGLSREAYDAALQEDLDEDGIPLWEEYIIGTDPWEENKGFTVDLQIDENGIPMLSWTPDLNEGGTVTARTYTIEHLDWDESTGRLVVIEESVGVSGEKLLPSAREKERTSGFYRVKISLP